MLVLLFHRRMVLAPDLRQIDGRLRERHASTDQYCERCDGQRQGSRIDVRSFTGLRRDMLEAATTAVSRA
jgi:hypothetical protein